MKQEVINAAIECCRKAEQLDTIPHMMMDAMITGTKLYLCTWWAPSAEAPSYFGHVDLEKATDEQEVRKVWDKFIDAFIRCKAFVKERRIAELKAEIEQLEKEA